MPWDILGLDAESATEREVKRAYARLLRQHRPDKDPEGFKRIHEAYTQALLQLEWRNYDSEYEDEAPNEVEEPRLTETGETTIAPGEDSLSASAFGVPSSFGLPGELTALELGLHSDDSETVIEELKALEKTIQDQPGLLSEWNDALVRLSEDNPDPFYGNLPLSIAVTELCDGHSTLTTELLDHLLARGDYPKLTRLGQELLRKRDLLTSPAAARLVTQLAGELAIVDPDLAEKLLDVAYESLPSGERSWLIAGLEQRVIGGRDFTRFPPKVREFWARCLRNPDGEDWKLESNREAIQNLTASVDPDWQGYSQIEEALPDDLRTFVTRRRNARRQEILHASNNTGGQSSGSEDSSRFGGCLILFVVWIVFKALISDSCSNKSSNIAPPEKDPITVPEDNSGEHRRNTLKQIKDAHPTEVEVLWRLDKERGTTNKDLFDMAKRLSSDPSVRESLLRYVLLLQNSDRAFEDFFNHTPPGQWYGVLKGQEKAFSYARRSTIGGLLGKKIEANKDQLPDELKGKLRVLQLTFIVVGKVSPIDR